jgi:hypothetical protein
MQRLFNPRQLSFYPRQVSFNPKQLIGIRNYRKGAYDIFLERPGKYKNDDREMGDYRDGPYVHEMDRDPTKFYDDNIRRENFGDDVRIVPEINTSCITIILFLLMKHIHLKFTRLIHCLWSDTCLRWVSFYL